MTCLHLQQYGWIIIMELWVDYDVAVCKRTFSSVSLQEGEQECFPRCFLVFVFISFFRPHLSVVVLHFAKCWHSFRRSCVITPPVWSAADAQEEEEEQRDNTDITTKLPSLTFLQHVSDIRALTWHQGWTNSTLVGQKWLLARPSLPPSLVKGGDPRTVRTN